MLSPKMNFLIQKIQENLSELKSLRGEHSRNWWWAMLFAWSSQKRFDSWVTTRNEINWKIKKLIEETEDLQSALENEVNNLENQRGQ